MKNSGDWIKIRTDLYRDPKVIMMAKRLADPEGPLETFVNQNCQCEMAVTLNVLRGATCGALVAVWGAVRHQGRRKDDDLLLENVPLSVLDDLADLPGFGDAMARVGWVVETEKGLVFPRFFELHNQDPSENAAEKKRERQRRYREKQRRHGGASPPSQSGARVRERVRVRETVNKPPTPLFSDLPPDLDLPQMRTALEDWERYRREIKKPLTKTMAKKQIQRFSEWGVDRSIAAIEHTIAMGWQGLREPEQPTATGNNKPRATEPQTRDHAKLIQDAIDDGRIKV